MEIQEKPLRQAKLNFQAPSTELAQKAVQRLTQLIDIPRPAIVDVNIRTCTKGSRWGRICCGEVGVGWIVLDLTWQLHAHIKPAARRINLRDSGAAGLADVCNSTFGEDTLLKDMTRKAAAQISREAVEFLRAINDA